MLGSLFTYLFRDRNKAQRLELVARLMNATAEDFPLRTRKLLNQQECELYQLVKHAYEGQDVLVKTSLPRMVVSSDAEKTPALFQCIEHLVFLFVVMDTDSNVLACLDFYSPTSKKRKDVRLKACIMASLGVDYWVLSSDYIDDIRNIQAKFELLRMRQVQFQNSASQARKTDFSQVKEQLHELLKDRRSEVKTFSDSCTNSSEFSTNANSFLQALDER